MTKYRKRLMSMDKVKRDRVVYRYQRFARFCGKKALHEKQEKRLAFLFSVIELMGESKEFRQEMLVIAYDQINKWENIIIDIFYIDFWSENVFDIKKETILNHPMKYQLAQTHPFVIKEKDLEQWKLK
jgi:hypothetical protein